MKTKIFAGPTSLLIAGVLAFGGTAAMACDGKGKHRHGGDPLSKLERVLDLTDAQKEQLAALKEAKHESRKAMFAEKRENNFMQLDPNSATYQSDLEALAQRNADLAKAKTLQRAEFQAQVMSILTPEQQVVLQEKMEARKARFEKRMQRFEREEV